MGDDIFRRNAGAATPAQLLIIRLALIFGVGSLGAVILFLESEPTWEPTSSTGLGMLVYVFLGLVAIAVSLNAVMKRKQAATSDWGKRVSYGIIGWAACESTALFGGVYWMLTGDATLYVIGALLLLAALLLLNPRQTDQPQVASNQRL